MGMDGPKPRDPAGGNAWIKANRGRAVFGVAYDQDQDGMPVVKSARIQGGSYVVTQLDAGVGFGPIFFDAAEAIDDYLAKTRAEAGDLRARLALAERRIAAAEAIRATAEKGAAP
jgi:hypothetical protein